MPKYRVKGLTKEPTLPGPGAVFSKAGLKVIVKIDKDTGLMFPKSYVYQEGKKKIIQTEKIFKDLLNSLGLAWSFTKGLVDKP